MTGPAAVKTDHQRFFVVDFGSQYAQLIARRVRELGCFAEMVMPHDLDSRIDEAQGVIFSGSPWSAYDEEAPRVAAAPDERPDRLSMRRHRICGSHDGRWPPRPGSR